MQRKTNRSRASWWGMALVGVIALSVLGASRPARAADPYNPPRRVKVLWLGDDGHHVPLERCRQIYSAIGGRGIDLTYTDRVEDLNPQTLGRFDVLMVYANIARISPDQEKALFDFVEGGHGFAPIHCGSACFNNSKEVVGLMGGRFLKHKTGVFKETIVQPEHPIEKGLKPIENWDETYVHADHNEKDRIVLGVREEAGVKEPYTWVRTQGKGRVFYTAWGHDERTWANADFRLLLERGLRWAAGDWALEPVAVQEPFDYQEVVLPQYRVGVALNKTGGEAMQMQLPVSPAESMKHMVLPPGFEAKLFAADPEIYKPICFTWDERGRLWISETIDYPNNKQPMGEGHDRIVILEDTKGTGVADKQTVYADKLSIPTSMVRAHGGIVIAQAPEMLFLKDGTDGDRAEGAPKVLFTGWGVGDTHAGPSNLHYGFDGWIYGTVGYSGFRGTVGGQPISFGAGVFRFKPDFDGDNTQLEFMGSTNNNTWGFGLSEDNQVFASTANGNPSFYLGIPNRFFEQVRGWVARRPPTIADTWKFFPVTKKVRQVDYFGGYTAGAGHELYTARSFPKEYWNRIAFVTEPTGHLIGQFVMQPSGAAYLARNDFSLFTSDDEWTAPIAAAVGPDGAVWFSDWYNYIVQHNPIPVGFQKGKGNAYVTPLRDKTHGRIYRIVYKDGKPSQTFDLANATPEKLLVALKSDNLFWRMTAQRLLTDRGNKDVVPQLIAAVADTSVDAIGINGGAINALWALRGLGVLDGNNAPATAAAVKALRHPSAGVRQAALAVLPRTAETAEAILNGKMLDDKDAQVRKVALLALAEAPTSDLIGAAVLAAVTNKRNAGDTDITDAATIAAAKHDAAFLKAAFGDSALKSTGAAANKPARVNLFANGSFEQPDHGNRAGQPAEWVATTYGGQATFEWAAGGRTGERCVKISSDTGADAGWAARAKVEPNTDYKFTVWVKIDKVQRIGAADGVLLNVHLTPYKTKGITGTNNWKQLELSFNSGNATSVTVNCLFGGYGKAKGTAWFDDAELTAEQSTSLPGALGRVVSIVSRHYAMRGPTDSVVSTLAALKDAGPAVQAVVIDGLAAGWPNGQTPQLTEADADQVRALMTALPADVKDRLLVLADRWKRGDLFTAQSAAAALELSHTVLDAAADPSKRVDAAHRLVHLRDTPETVASIVKQITPAAPPALQTGFIEALSESAQDIVGAALVKQWKSLTPSSQQAAAALLLRRPVWVGALLGGLKEGVIDNKDLKTEQWQALVRYPDADLAARAKALEKAAGHAPTADRQQIVEKLLPLASKPGTAALGKEIFQKNCIVCHTVNNDGGKVGPDLSGIGARPKPENLIDIVDPNRAVEGTYREWIVKTQDEIISGRLLTESQTSVEIIDSAAQKHLIQRKDIKSLTTSNRSVMPEGFEALSEEDLANLLEYLAKDAAVKH